MNHKETILERLTMLDILQFYTPRNIVKNRCPCPLHDGKDNNFEVYNTSFYCWVCHRGGDIIKFVSLLFGLDYKSSIVKIDYDFNLCLSTNKMTYREQEQIRQLNLQKLQEQKQKEEYENNIVDEFWKVYDELIRLDLNFIRHKPTSPDEELNPLFVEACHRLEYQKCLLAYWEYQMAVIGK